MREKEGGMKLALIEWNDKNFCIGSADIDEQHKKWIDITNKLDDALMSPSGKDYKHEIFKELRYYTEYHFSYEEKLMQEIGYPGLQEQKDMHSHFKTSILEQIQNMYQGEPLMMSQLMDQLKNWLTNHILKEDRKIGEYLSSR